VADEVILLADAAMPAAASAAETHILDAFPDERRPRQTLVLVQRPDIRSPGGTRRWLDRRRIDRHVHVREGNAADFRRLARIMTGRAVGIVLAGGAARGLAHIGVLRALAERGISGDIVGGTSMGSIIAAWHAVEVEGEELIRAAERAFGGNPSGDFNLLPIVSLLKGTRTHGVTLNEVIRQCGAEIDAEDTWRTYFCVASDFSNEREAVLSRGPLHRNILASFAIPGIFPPVIIDGRMMFDGGMFNNFPVDVMEAMGAGRIIGIDMRPGQRAATHAETIPTGMQMLIDHFRDRNRRRYRLPALPQTMLAACFMTSSARQEEAAARAHLHIRPRVKKIGLLDWGKLHDAVSQGYGHATRQLDSLPPGTLDTFR
jgi:NTE family protein